MPNEDYFVTTTIKGDRFWDKTKELALNCSWVAGPKLQQLMETYEFKEWEKVFIAVSDTQVIGFSTLTEVDCIPHTQYRPFVGFVFVAEAYRANRIAFKMINAIADYAKAIGFEKVYIASNEIGFYEKADFKFVEYQEDNWGNQEQVFVRNLS